MKIAQVQFSPWDKAYDFSFSDLEVAIGDKVIVETEFGLEMGTVAKISDSESAGTACACPKSGECPHSAREIKPILRLAGSADMERIRTAEEKTEALDYARAGAKKLDLPMKLVDVNFSFDDSRITFAFIADGRVDFRELVKELTRRFNRSIRLQQIGIRDEAKLTGDCGHCGRQLCCRSFLREFASITSEMADVQQCGHRGSDRISGACGRLMCCLNYEIEGYKYLAGKMPPLGARVNVDGKKGVVVGHHLLKESVNVQFPGDKEGESVIVEVDLNRNKE